MVYEHRFIPNPLTSKCVWLRKEADKLIKELIKSRYSSKDEQENDFLGFLLSSTLTQKQIEDECKVFSTAGYETISIALSWAFILLGTHTEWQDKAREEIDEVLKGNQPSFEILGRLKMVSLLASNDFQIMNYILHHIYHITMHHTNYVSRFQWISFVMHPSWIATLFSSSQFVPMVHH